MMTQAKLLKFKTTPINFLFRQFLKFEANYMNSIDLPIFPKELELDASELNNGLKRISAFAISKYFLQDLSNLRPKKIIKGLISLPRQIYSIIWQARSKF